MSQTYINIAKSFNLSNLKKSVSSILILHICCKTYKIHYSYYVSLKNFY